MTITAISFFNKVAEEGNIYYAIYEGTTDIDINQTYLPYPIVNLNLVGTYREYNNFNIVTDLCNAF